MTFLLLWLAFSIAVGFMATTWGRSGGLWFVGAILFTPILAGVALLLAGKVQQEPRAKGFSFAKYSKVCPDCAERVRIQARVCKHCGHEWTDSEVRSSVLEAVERYDEPLFYCVDSSKVVSSNGAMCPVCDGDVYDGRHPEAEEYYSEA
jgi:rRNA maturation endonuclease Nob1